MLVEQSFWSFKNGSSLVAKGCIKNDDIVISTSNNTRQVEVNNSLSRNSFKSLPVKHYRRIMKVESFEFYGKVALDREALLLDNDRTHIGMSQTDAFQATRIHNEYLNRQD